MKRNKNWGWIFFSSPKVVIRPRAEVYATIKGVTKHSLQNFFFLLSFLQTQQQRQQPLDDEATPFFFHSLSSYSWLLTDGWSALLRYEARVTFNLSQLFSLVLLPRFFFLLFPSSMLKQRKRDKREGEIKNSPRISSKRGETNEKFCLWSEWCPALELYSLWRERSKEKYVEQDANARSSFCWGKILRLLRSCNFREPDVRPMGFSFFSPPFFLCVCDVWSV